ALWTVTTADGGTATARVVVSAMGPLDRPFVPELKGIEKFQGKAFHSQDWDHDYDLKGKKLAVIGTGASAIQFVPQIAREVNELHLMQRTPPWIMPKPDRRVSSLEKALFKRLPALQQAMRGGIYAALESRALAFVFAPRLMRLIQTLAVRHIHKHIKDPVLRKKLTPDYTIGCKRILISNDYYPALARSNVAVNTNGVAEVREHSIVTQAGEEIAVDAIIYGTGFHATDPLPRGVVFGKGGQDLLDAWADGIEAYKGCVVSGFPNLFIVPGPNTGLGHNSMVYMIESQISYVMDALHKMDNKGLRSVDVRPEVQRAWNDDIQSRIDGTVWNTGGCKSWYLNEDGKNVTLWPGFTFAYRLNTRRFDLANFQTESLVTAITPESDEVPAAA
ncbi:MAG: flavin-containing monooxygenase, partial [Nevskiales bacterium]